ncbi:MAG: hypothetical protein QXF61_02410 [Nitrososphaeria archaeon]
MHLGTRLISVKDGPLRLTLEKRIEDLGLKIKCITAFVPSSQIPHIPEKPPFVLSSYLEGLSYELLQAIAAGLPSVASDIE